ncbi:hypothetical protein FJV80_13145 [Mesorhizobium sp. WSM4310]|uniref:DUF6375 family protein n=1 Tax=Mesorhizobium sp. WSM4310 TaxID=2589883 RepID=UPI00115DA727|nr:DUF6375 family protein [Mesorhizobium sp. WSM4310]TRC87672.1 hypothetical protein FJV80_13145 [Mesorhizobium sp. WSM4310]
MKVWIGYGSEHSANLVIIGKFESAGAAKSTLDTLTEATNIALADEAAGRLKAGEVTKNFSKDQLEFYQRTNLALDPEQLLYEFHARVEGDRVVITTEESEINSLLKALLHGGAKIEVYSAHDHGGPYGRRTKTG